MPFPKVRLTINHEEGLLLMPGLNTVANGHAGAKCFGAYPNRHPYDRIDLVASAVYEDRAYDDGMAGRFLALRNMVQDIPQSRKIRFDSVDLAVAGFVLRLWKAHKPSDATDETCAAVKQLQKKIERYRRRARCAAIKKSGKSSYRETAERWRRFAAWAKYNLLYFKMPSNRPPCRAKFWKEQRRQLTTAIATALTGRFFEVPSEIDMVKLVTLASRSLKKCRHAVGLTELLQAPNSHAEFLVAFVKKRVDLKRLPGAPVPAWQAASDRADVFRAFQQRSEKSAISDSSTRLPDAIARNHTSDQNVPPKAIMIGQVPEHQTGRTEKVLAKLTEAALLNSMARWLLQTVTMAFAQGVCAEARSQISHQLLDQYRGPTIADKYEGIFEHLMVESGPAEFSINSPTKAHQYAARLLWCLLTLQQTSEWMNQAIGVALGRAKEMEDQDRQANCLAAICNGRHSARIRA